MSNHKLTTFERLAAMQERIERAEARRDLAQQMQVCSFARDCLADQLNVVIDERDEARAKVAELERQIACLLGDKPLNV